MKGLDTTFLIDILRNEPGAAAKAIQLDTEVAIFTTEANIYEIVSGLRKGADLERALRDLEMLISRLTVLPLDRKASMMAGIIARELLQGGKMIDDVDCLTAGTLIANGCDTVVTRNVKHFGRIRDLKVESY